MGCGNDETYNEKGQRGRLVSNYSLLLFPRWAVKSKQGHVLVPPGVRPYVLSSLGSSLTASNVFGSQLTDSTDDALVRWRTLCNPADTLAEVLILAGLVPSLETAASLRAIVERGSWRRKQVLNCRVSVEPSQTDHASTVFPATQKKRGTCGRASIDPTSLCVSSAWADSGSVNGLVSCQALPLSCRVTFCGSAV